MKRPADTETDTKSNGDRNVRPRTDNLYLETVNKRALDFDREKICSVTLAKQNVYCCLTCGQFFQGKSVSSPAVEHAASTTAGNVHKLFMSLDTARVFVLPENNEVHNAFFDDIKEALDPKYTRETLVNKVHKRVVCKDLGGAEYVCGYIGLNGAPGVSFQNVVLLLLAHVESVRDWLLLNTSHEEVPGLDSNNVAVLDNCELVQKMGHFVRRYWYARLFRSHVAPFEVLNFANKMAGNAFKGNSDPKMFLSWVLNNMSLGFANKKSNVLTKAFQGKIEVSHFEETKLGPVLQQKKASRFWTIQLDLPDKKNMSTKEAKLQEVSLHRLIEQKFGGAFVESETRYKKYSILKLPQYLILTFDRFKDYAFNDTVVSFENELDMSQYVPGHRYRHICNLCHYTDGDADYDVEKIKVFEKVPSKWKVQLLDPLTSDWYEIDQLKVSKINRKLLFLSESYIQVWQRTQ